MLVEAAVIQKIILAVDYTDLRKGEDSLAGTAEWNEV